MHVECGTGELSAAGDAAAVVTRALSLSGLGILKNINKRGEDSSKVKRGGKERTGAPTKGRRCRRKVRSAQLVVGGAIRGLVQRVPPVRV